MKKIIIIFLEIIITIISFGAIASTDRPGSGYNENLTGTKIFAYAPIKKRIRNYWEKKIKTEGISYKDILGPLCIETAYIKNDSKAGLVRRSHSLGDPKADYFVDYMISRDVKEEIKGSLLMLINNLLEKNTGYEFHHSNSPFDMNARFEVFENYYTYNNNKELYNMVLEIRVYNQTPKHLEYMESYYLEIDFRLKNYGNIEYILNSAKTYQTSFNTNNNSKINEVVSEQAIVEFALDLRRRAL